MLGDIDWRTVWQFISRLADVLAVVVFVLQLVLLVFLRRIQRRVYLVGRVPELLQALARQRGELAILLESFDANAHLIRQRMATLRPIVENLRRKLTSPHRKEATQLLKRVNAYLGTDTTLRLRYEEATQSTEQACRTIHLAMVSLEESLRQERADRSWTIG